MPPAGSPPPSPASATAVHEDAHAWVAAALAAREELLSAIESGECDLAAALQRARSDELVGIVHVLPVVQALPGWGKVQSRRTLDALGIGFRTPLADVDADRLLDAFSEVST